LRTGLLKETVIAYTPCGSVSQLSMQFDIVQFMYMALEKKGNGFW